MKGIIKYNWICSCGMRGKTVPKRGGFGVSLRIHNKKHHNGSGVLTHSDRYIVYCYLNNEYWISFKDYAIYRNDILFWELLDDAIEKSQEHYKEFFMENDPLSSYNLKKKQNRKGYLNFKKSHPNYTKEYYKKLKKVKKPVVINQKFILTVGKNEKNY